jgi:two-component system chemotaxis sensor kinase CheA
MARVLVADDAPDVRTLIETILAADGHDVVTAADGLEAWQRYLDDSFDLVCTDLEMPRLNGVELTRAVRAHPAGDVPILLVSGSGSLQDVRDAREAGISAFLEKPFSVSALRGQVRALVSPVE